MASSIATGCAETWPITSDTPGHADFGCQLQRRCQQPRKTRADRDRHRAHPEHIERSIYLIRGEKVLLDADLASLYGVETKALIQAMKRNRDRFPCDFMFQTVAAGVCKLEVTICDLKLGRSTIPAVCLYGARRGDAFERAPQ